MLQHLTPPLKEEWCSWMFFFSLSLSHSPVGVHVSSHSLELREPPPAPRCGNPFFLLLSWWMLCFPLQALAGGVVEGIKFPWTWVWHEYSSYNRLHWLLEPTRYSISTGCHESNCFHLIIHSQLDGWQFAQKKTNNPGFLSYVLSSQTEGPAACDQWNWICPRGGGGGDLNRIIFPLSPSGLHMHIFSIKSLDRSRCFVFHAVCLRRVFLLVRVIILPRFLIDDNTPPPGAPSLPRISCCM